MIITDIKQQVRRPERYSVYADGKFLFGLSESGLLQLGIRIGKEFTEAELAELRSSADFDKLYDLCLRYIAIRQRSEWEVRTYLKRKQASAEDIDDLIKRLYEHRWLDDASFARAWVANRRLLRHTSAVRLRQELRAKQVSTADIDSALQADDGDERQILRELIAKKQRLTRYAQDPQKLIQYLMRQGFRYDEVRKIMTNQDDD